MSLPGLWSGGPGDRLREDELSLSALHLLPLPGPGDLGSRPRRPGAEHGLDLLPLLQVQGLAGGELQVGGGVWAGGSGAQLNTERLTFY